MTLSQAAAKSRANLLAGVVGREDLGERAQLGVRAEHEVDRVAVHLTSPVPRSRPS